MTDKILSPEEAMSLGGDHLSDEGKARAAVSENVNKAELRVLVAKLYCASGCSCCRDDAGWEAASEALGAMLDVPMYEDGSARDWYSIKRAAADIRP